MNRKIYALLAILQLLAYSCVSLDQVSIEYLQPAKINFPSQIRKIVVVNNSIETDNKDNITRRIAHDGSVVLEATLQGDAKKVAEELSKGIAAENYFDEVLICDSALRSNDKSKREQELTQEEVVKLTSELGADMVISVENIFIKKSERVEILPNLYCAVVDAKVSPLIRIYLPNRSKPMLSILPEDSIFWEKYAATEAIARKEINEGNLIAEASEFAGTIPVKYLLPSWSKAQRYHYISGSFELKDAAIYVKEKNWDAAFKLWEQNYNGKSKKAKFRSAFNIAVYYEMNDSIDKAIEWAEIADQLISKKGDNSFDTILAKEYVNVLKARKAEIQTLNIQMSRFKDNF